MWTSEFHRFDRKNGFPTPKNHTVDTHMLRFCSTGSKVINLQDQMSKILNKQECITFQLCRFLNKHCLDPEIIFWGSINWSPSGPIFSKVSETLYYGCLRYGFQGWRIHFWHQIIKIPMFIHDLIDQLWQKLRYHQNCRISPI